MLLYRHEESRLAQGTPDEVFAVVADVTHHPDLAGSHEIKSLRMLSSGPIGVGSEWETDEEIRVGHGTQSFVARSRITEFEPPHHISWTSTAPTRPAPRRIQWTYDICEAGHGTRVTERVEVDLGPVKNILMKLPYRFRRAKNVEKGMRLTLTNVYDRTQSLR